MTLLTSVEQANSKLSSWIAHVLLAPVLGHGRATEMLLACMAGSYGGALVLFPHLGFESQATTHLFWKGAGIYIAIPLLMKCLLTGYGLFANIYGWMYERSVRFVGAFLGASIWMWFVIQFNFRGATGSVGTFACFWFFFFSIRVMGMSLLGLPIPGRPGRQL